MTVYKYIFFIILLIGSIGCDRNTNTEFPSREKQDTPQQSEIRRNKPEDSNEVTSITESETKEDSAQSETANQETVLNDPTSDKRIGSGDTEYNWWMFGAIASIVVNVVLLWLLLKTIYYKNDYKKGKEYYKKKFKERNWEKVEKPAIIPRKKTSSEVTKENPTVQKTKESKHNYQDEKPIEVPLSIQTSYTYSNEANVPSKAIVLYAEKATDRKIFSLISEQKNEYKSIFKLTLSDSESEKAEFEVVDSDFVLKMAANSPDTYLYTVCKPENSNQNYSGEIITTKRGIAHKIDGKWKVSEEGKATIKFQ